IIIICQIPLFKKVRYESLEEIKHTGAITYNAMVQNKDRRQSLSTTQRRTDLTQATCSPDMKPKRSFEEFTPIIAADDSDDETYLFQCSCAGLYQCSVTGLVFVMKGEGDVVYRTVPWNRKLLAQHHKKPAGPLFDIKCQQQSVCQLHLPHCELISTGGGQFLKVAHVDDEGIECITPHQITETHVVINITGFSCYGIFRDDTSLPGPVKALIFLFYKPLVDSHPRSVLSLFLIFKQSWIQPFSSD
uniref:FIIND domain-containing protein n=1 Tax=Oreochromis niloticus TaxID=8128 RepID=A0A669AVP4_ORENI